MSRATLFRKERRARGLCAVAGCPEHTGEETYRCERCAAAHRADSKLAYQTKMARKAGEASTEERGEGQSSGA